jgi:hypothetical protein
MTLSERDRSFFWPDEAHGPLPPGLIAQLGLLETQDAARVFTSALSALPPGWPDQLDSSFENEAQLWIGDSWGDPRQLAEVRRWLYDRGLPFRRVVYLLYERDQVVQTTWRMVVRYWDALAWSVGFAMIVLDPTLQWACCFHHEDVIVFGSRGKMGQDQRGPSARGVSQSEETRSPKRRCGPIAQARSDSG